MKSKILWTDKTWNPMTGCTKVSPACDNCYAERMAKRLRAMGAKGYWNQFEPTVHLEKFNECQSWNKPKKVFVNSMSDTFHEAFTLSDIVLLFACMTSAHNQTFQILTKRAKRLSELSIVLNWPKNVWCGVTAENQKMADERIPHLLSVPAALRFVSVEPMLGPVDLDKYLLPVWKEGNCAARGVHWVICGGESGPNARPMNPDWVRSLRDQCVTADVPFFFKQWGEWLPIVHADYCNDYHKQQFMINDAEWVTGGTRNGCVRVGKKAAGRLLDGREWNQFPEVKTI